MASNASVLVFLGGILFFIQGTFTDKGLEVVPITLTVENSLSNAAPQMYFTSVVEGGVLLGALRRLEQTQQDFKFTVTEDPDFGLYLQSVNGVAGDGDSYWEIVAQRPGEDTRLTVGVGCYKPKASEHIILRFNRGSRK